MLWLQLNLISVKRCEWYIWTITINIFTNSNHNKTTHNKINVYGLWDVLQIRLGFGHWHKYICIYAISRHWNGASLLWRHNGRDGVSHHQPHDCLLNHLFRRRSKKTSKLRVTGLCAGNSPVTGELPAQMASNAENVSIWWRHHMGAFIPQA